MCLIMFASLSFSAKAQTQKVILLGFYGGNYVDGTITNTTATEGVPCPVDSNSLIKTGTWFYDQLAKEANTIAKSGFTSVWLPPVSKGGLGFYGTANNQKTIVGGIYDIGYGLFDHYDLGDKQQMGRYQTRYGSRTQLTRLIATLRANGLDAYEDLVTNQISILANVKPLAPTYKWYQYKNAFDSIGGGRFPKYTTDFHNPPQGTPGSSGGPQDPDVPATTFPDGSLTGQKEGYFGPDFAHITGEQNVNGIPGVYCATQLNLWGDWLMKATGVQGYRLDDASGISWDFLKSFVNYGSLQGKYSVTELAGSPFGVAQLKTWLQVSMGKADSSFTMFDQVLQGALSAVCKTDQFYMPVLQSKYMSYGATNQMNPQAGSVNQGPFDIYRSLLVADPAQSVTVVNEIDSETGNNPVLPKECLLGYAYIMTIGFGTPCIPYRDWSTDAGSYGGIMIDSNNLNYHLNKLIWCHNFIIKGGLSNEYGSPNGHVYAFQKNGGQQAMVFLNSDQHSTNTVTVPTSIPNGTVLTDYTDHNVTATVINGQLTVTVPANINGRGYLVMAPPGITGQFTPGKTSVTQEWDGAPDLSIPPASGNEQEICRIWVDKGESITSTLLGFNTSNWVKDTNLELEIDRSSLDNSNNTTVASRTYNSADANQVLSYNTPVTSEAGYYSFWIKGNNLPAAKDTEWFNLQSTYTAPQTVNGNFNDTIASLTGATKPPIITPDTAGKIVLYPNPAHDTVAVQYKLAGNAAVTIKVINMNGKLVLRESAGTQAAGVNIVHVAINNIPAGVYVIRIQSGNTILVSGKFIKR